MIPPPAVPYASRISCCRNRRRSFISKLLFSIPLNNYDYSHMCLKFH